MPDAFGSHALSDVAGGSPVRAVFTFRRRADASGQPAWDTRTDSDREPMAAWSLN
jgi:hypothetical protein